MGKITKVIEEHSILNSLLLSEIVTMRTMSNSSSKLSRVKIQLLRKIAEYEIKCIH